MTMNRVQFQAGLSMAEFKAPCRETPRAQELCADVQGFSLHAAVRCDAHARQRLEHLCRYITRCWRRCKSASIRRRGSVFVRRRSALAVEGSEVGRAPGGALLNSVTTMWSFSASLAGQNGASGSNSGIGPSGTS